MVDTRFREIIASNFMFKELSSVEIVQLTETLSEQHFTGGSVIVREGEVADALFLIVSGGVNVIKTGGQFLAYLGPSGFFGEMALFSADGIRSATVEAAEDTRCIVVHKDVIHRFCSDHPNIGIRIYRAIIASLAGRLEATSADLATLMRCQVCSQREIGTLVARAKSRSGSDER